MLEFSLSSINKILANEEEHTYVYFAANTYHLSKLRNSLFSPFDSPYMSF